MPEENENYYHSTEGRKVTITSSLGEGVLRFRSLRGREGLSRLFEYELVVTVAAEDAADVTFAALGGKQLTVSFTTNETRNAGADPRHINGYVAALTQSRGKVASGKEITVEFRLRLVPWLWFLTQRADCRIFNSLDGSQPNSVKDILNKVFEEAGFNTKTNLDGLTETYPDLDYCVQFNETDFAFVSRLMEREGIYYYFEHTEDDHKMVILDAEPSHTEFSPGYYEKLPYVEQEQDRAIEMIDSWSATDRVRTAKYHQRDYDYNDPQKDLKTDADADPAPDHELADQPWYEYPGRYIEKTDGDRYTRQRLEELRLQSQVFTAEGNTLGLVAGYRFELVDAPDDSLNGEYIVLETVIEADGPTDTGISESSGLNEVPGYTVKATVLPKAEPYRPPRRTPIPRAHGPHTAVVVGQDGEEITTEELGRIKIKFHWDRSEKNNQDCSCWVRVAQTWASQSWGSQFIPRHGMEVIVTYIDGDLDRPLVVGAVYNGQNALPYSLPDNATQSGVKSRSSKEGADDNFNEIRFEDKKDEEQIYIHAEKNMDLVVENSMTQTIGHDKQDPGDLTIDIYNNRTVTIDQGDDTLTVSSGNQTVDVAQVISVTAGDEIVLETGAARIQMLSDGTINIEGATITVTGSQDVILDATSNFEATGMSAKMEGSGAAEVTAGGNLTLSGSMTSIN